ncbi:MAG: imidazole glycerol phosphate synthase subunit HisH [Sphingomonadales bacterium]|jgi:glutamine amidotransferase
MTSSVVVVDYGAGNLRSVAKALEHAAAQAGLDTQIEVTSNPKRVLQADRIVLPGVGAFGDCRAGLDAIEGLKVALDEMVLQKHKPFLGICVGMQLMAEWGLEHGRHQGLGWVKGEVGALRPSDTALKIPHMGWNALNIKKTHPLLQDVANGTHVYFVHSYALRGNDSDVLATSDYGGELPAMIAKDNMAGVQFHPEKSQRAGLEILKNFLNWQP